MISSFTNIHRFDGFSTYISMQHKVIPADDKTHTIPKKKGQVTGSYIDTKLIIFYLNNYLDKILPNSARLVYLLGQYLVDVVTCYVIGSVYLCNYLSLVPFPIIVSKCDTSQMNGQYTCSTDPETGSCNRQQFDNFDPEASML